MRDDKPLTGAAAAESPLYLVRDMELRYGSDKACPAAFSCGELAIGRGEILALTGPNGSGKSTFLKALNGLVSVQPGSLLYRGVDSRISDKIRRETVYLHQHPYILSGSVAGNLRFGCRARRMTRSETEARVNEVMEMLGLSGYGQRRHRQLSGGEAQRVALARVIATGAEVLLLDEPTASADAVSAGLIRTALRECALKGTTIIFASHDADLVGDLATRRLAFDRGRIAGATSLEVR